MGFGVSVGVCVFVAVFDGVCVGVEVLVGVSVLVGVLVDVGECFVQCLNTRQNGKEKLISKLIGFSLVLKLVMSV